MPTFHLRSPTSKSFAMNHTKPTEAAKLPAIESVELSISTEDMPLSEAPKASKSSKALPRNLVAELAPHGGYASISLDNYGRVDDGYYRRSTRISQPTAKASGSGTYMDAPARSSPVTKPRGLAKVQKKKSTAKPNPKSSPTAAQKARSAEILLQIAEEEDDLTSGAETLSPATLDRSPTSSPLPSPDLPAAVALFNLSHACAAPASSPSPSPDLLAAVALFNLGHVCAAPDSICPSFTTLTVAASGLVTSACGEFSWYVGPVGVFEIDHARWPLFKRTITYILGDGYVEATVPSSCPTTPDSGADTELDEQMAQEEEERQEERGEEACRVLDGQVEEWMTFCKFWKKMAWGVWLNPFQRPGHIGEETWAQYWDDIEEKEKAKRAARDMKYCF